MDVVESLKSAILKIESLGIDPNLASLYGVDLIEIDDNIQSECYLISKDYDIYDMLSSKKAKDSSEFYSGLCLTTSGWAAPLAESPDENDVAPSQHPEKRRVRLIVFINKNSEVASQISFIDEEKENIMYDTTAEGPLAEALLALISHA